MNPLLIQWLRLAEIEEVAHAFPLWKPVAKDAEAKLVAALQRQGGFAICDNVALQVESMREDGKLVATWITAKLLRGNWPSMLRTVHAEELVGPQNAWKRGLDLNQIPAERRKSVA